MAVWPSPEVMDVLRALPRPPVPGLRWTTEDQWHVTLRFLGEASVEGAGAALRGLRHGERPEAVVGPHTERLGRTIVHLPVAGLDSLAAAVVAATAGVGEEPPADRPFRGHLTLGRANRGRADLRAVGGVPAAGRWTVDEVTLVASRLHPKGARYEVVERVSLPTPASDA